VSSLAHDLARARSEASSHLDKSLSLEVDCTRLQSEVEEKERTLKSLEGQVEDLGRSLSKINTQYQRQFARLEADQATTVESVKGEARAQAEAARQEALAQVAAIKAESQALIGRQGRLSFLRLPRRWSGDHLFLLSWSYPKP